MGETKPKLLIVEDDEGLQAQLKWSYDDFDVVIAGTRAEALTALRLSLIHISEPTRPY